LKALRKHYNPTAEIPWHELEPLKIHELSGPDPIDWTYAGLEFGETLTIPYVPFGQTEPVQGHTGMTKLPAFGTDYIMFDGFEDDVIFGFDGDDISDFPLEPYEQWSFDGDEWYSGAVDLVNSLIGTTVDVPDTAPTLELTTYWDIEDYWDFGFIQVSYTGDWDDWILLQMNILPIFMIPVHIQTL
jgi:hypothetical protein